MTGFSPLALQAALDVLRPDGATGDLCVAFSGGVDSTVLLAALAELKAAGSPGRLRALHVDHQLHPDSARWQVHCAEVAASLGVDYSSEQVTVPESSGKGIEAAARTVRYEALRGHLKAGEILLTAHHADDQLETVLLALMRGSGVRGLSGMPSSAPCSSGWHQRPLLEFTRAELEVWGRERGVRWITDPANSEERYSRSVLRHAVTPVLRERWPQVATVAARSARHLAEAADLLDDLARLDLAAVGTGDCLQVAALGTLPSPRRRNLLRFWLREQGLPIPSTRKLAGLEHDMLAAREDRHPVVTWQGGEVRRRRGLLYASALPPTAERLATSD